MIASPARKQDLQHRREALKCWSSQEFDLFNKAPLHKEGCSLTALFLLDRAWSANAAPLVFRRLDSHKCSSLFFRAIVLPKYARFVEEVDLEGDDTAEEDRNELLISLPLFPRLRYIALDGYISLPSLELPRFEGENDTASADTITRRDAFRYAVRNVKELFLNECTPRQLVWLLASVPTLERLNVFGFLYNDENLTNNPHSVEEDRRIIESSIARLPNLVELEIFDVDNSSNRPGGIGFGTSWQDHGWQYRPVLRSLNISRSHGGLDGSLWSFAQHFAATLESLPLGGLTEVEAARELLNSKAGMGQGVVFTKLRLLRCFAPVPLIPIILSRFSSSPLCQVDVWDEEDKERDKTIDNAFGVLDDALALHRSTLSQVTINCRSKEGSTPRLQVRRHLPLAKDMPTVITIKNSWDIWTKRETSRRRFDPRQAWMSERRCDAIDEVVQFPSNLSGRFQTTGDVYGAEQMMAALEPMRSLMMKEQM